MKKISIFMLMLAAISLVGCSKDDPESNSVDTCDSVMTLEEAQMFCYSNIINTWTDMEANESDTTYVIRDMRPDDVMPNVYYLGVDSQEEAEEFFMLHFAGDVSLQKAGIDGISVNLGEYGQIHFSNGGSDPLAFATIKMQLKRMSQDVTIYFIPRGAMNSVNSVSPFSMGDVVRVTSGNAQPKYYICTVEYGGSNSQKGRLMRWGNTSYSYKEDHFKEWYYPNNPADMVAVEGLKNLMYNERYKDQKNFLLTGFTINGEKNEERIKSWGVETWNSLLYMTYNWRWDGMSFFISQSIDDGWCWSCWRHPKRANIDYFCIEGGKMYIRTTYCGHDWNDDDKYLPNGQVFKNTPQTEMFMFEADTEITDWRGRVTQLTKVWPQRGR